MCWKLGHETYIEDDLRANIIVGCKSTERVKAGRKLTGDSDTKTKKICERQVGYVLIFNSDELTII